MSDPRRTPVNDRVAARAIAAGFPDLRPVDGTPQQITTPVAELLRRPGGPRDRQLLFGDLVSVLEINDDHAFVQVEKDAYVGYVEAGNLGPVLPATHWVSAPATHAYAAADMKSPDLATLSLGSQMRVTRTYGGFAETTLGFVPQVHLSELADRPGDPVTVAEMFLGTPYLWGGNSCWGIDCSGLVQAAVLACGFPCPGDSDQQQAELGSPVPPGSGYARGDLLFWKGHVAWVADPDTLLHANAHHMATAHEPLQDAIARIARQGDGPVLSQRRL